MEKREAEIVRALLDEVKSHPVQHPLSYASTIVKSPSAAALQNRYFVSACAE